MREGRKRGTTARLATRDLFTLPDHSIMMNAAKVKRCVLSGSMGSTNNKIAVLTLGFLSLMGSVSARRGSTIIGQTATAMICHLNFASSTPALCLRPLPDVNIFLLFELRDLLKEQTPGMLCSFVAKLWHFQLDIAHMKGTCLSFFLHEQQEFLSLAAECWIHRFGKHLLFAPSAPHLL